MSADERAQLEAELARLCREYLYAWQGEDRVGKYLAAGMMTGQLARLYRLDPPEGLVPIEDTLRDIGRQLLGEA